MIVNSPAAIIGGFGLGNFGDDLLMLASINAVRRVYDPSEITVVVYPGGEAYCRKLDPSTKYVGRASQTDIRSNVAIYGGGTQFYDFGPQEVRRTRYERAQRFLFGIMHRRMSISNLWQRSPMRLSIAEPTTRAAISIGLGPFKTSESQQAATDSLRDCEFLSVRDQTSLNYCRDCGLSNAMQYSDFGYASTLWVRELPVRPKQKPSRRIGIVVRDWYRSKQGHHHLAASIELAKSLQRRGHETEFFVFDAIADTTCVRMLKAENLHASIWNPSKMTVEKQLDALSTCDVLVTSRAHGAIVGSVLGIPSVCTVIEPKLKIMAESLGGAAATWNAPFDVPRGVEVVESMLDNVDQASAEAARVSELHSESALQSIDQLAIFLRQFKARGDDRSNNSSRTP